MRPLVSRSVSSVCMDLRWLISNDALEPQVMFLDGWLLLCPDPYNRQTMFLLPWTKAGLSSYKLMIYLTDQLSGRRDSKRAIQPHTDIY